MKIITSGNPYIDIDAYASCIAYAELLKLKGVKAKAVSTAKINESITESLLKLDFKLDNYQKDKNDEFIILDISNKEYFDSIVIENKVIEVIDHHFGHEEYWKDKLGNKAKIEHIGAVASVIVELYEKEKIIEKMPKDIAYLLMSAILDNTLNFKAKSTTDRDKFAYKKLEKISNCEENYIEKYFLECQLKIQKNLKKAIENDTKIENINILLPKVFSQLTVWDKTSILDNKNIIYETLEQFDTNWMMNLICLKDEKSYIIVSNTEVQRRLEDLLQSKFIDDIMQLDHVWLRKEIIKKSILEIREIKNYDT